MSLINEKEYDIYDFKPVAIDKLIAKKHDEYEDSRRILQNKCPSCKSENYVFAFDKYSFHYIQCKECASLYVQNLLFKDDIHSYEKYLQKKLYGTEEYEKYLDVLSEKFSSELDFTFSRLFSKKQMIKVAYIGNKSKIYKGIFNDFHVDFIEYKTVDNFVDKYFDLVIVDHFIEKNNELDIFMQKINSSLKNNAYVYITMRVGSGIDLLTLWEDSKVYPLEHMNLLSLEGIKILLGRNNFAIKELNTPGVLDIENILKTKSDNIPRFLSYLNNSKKQIVIEEFQAFIQKNLLSSFATIIAQKEDK